MGGTQANPSAGALASGGLAVATGGEQVGVGGQIGGQVATGGVPAGGQVAAGGGSQPGTGGVETGEQEPMQSEVGPGTSCGVGLPTLCAPDTEKCCIRSLQTDTCIDASDACSCGLRNCAVTEAYCDGPEDCGLGEVCCGTLNGGQGYSEFVCATACSERNSQRVACHQGDDDCPDGRICANSQLLTNVQICIDPATIEQ